jgi:hypothetical protein
MFVKRNSLRDLKPTVVAGTLWQRWKRCATENHTVAASQRCRKSQHGGLMNRSSLGEACQIEQRRVN